MRHLLLLACLLAVLAAAASATAQAPGNAVRQPALEPGKLPVLPGFPVFDPAQPGEVPNFDPQKMFDQMFGRGGAGEFDDEALANVEVTPAEEAKLGKQALDAARQQFASRNVKLVTRGKEVEYLSRLVELVHPLMTNAARYRKLNVYLIDSNEPEAYSLPGGHVLFSRGLLDAAQCEAALVVTAGHELAHIDRGHLLRRTRQWKLAQESFQPGKTATPDNLMQMMSLMPRLFSRPFGPEEELDADRDGITWAYRLGYDPLSVQLIFGALEAKANGGLNFLPAFLRTHPQSAERHENLKKTLRELAGAEQRDPLYIGRKNLERRLTRKQREFAE
ncbi:MAG: M48 family metallopeptidase [Planctomycetaceae bacterium]|nr:M48 family metallopeptidase [Planctomycetaceae bacterium]